MRSDHCAALAVTDVATYTEIALPYLFIQRGDACDSEASS